MRFLIFKLQKRKVNEVELHGLQNCTSMHLHFLPLYNIGLPNLSTIKYLSFKGFSSYSLFVS